MTDCLSLADNLLFSAPERQLVAARFICDMGQSRKSLAKSEEMRRLYADEKWSLQKVAAHFKLSPQAVQQRLYKIKGLNLRLPGRPGKQLARKTLVELYVVRNLSQRQIMEELSVTRYTLVRTLAKFRLSRLPEERWQRRNPQLYTMQIGESFELKKPQISSIYKNMHSKAKGRGIKITVRKINADLFRVTRIG